MQSTGHQWLLYEVKSEADRRCFLEVAPGLYKNDPNWIRPLDKDIEEVFDKEKNKFLKRGGLCIRWILKDTSGKSVGRVAAFVNRQYKQSQPTGGTGFFECIDNQDAANLLFDQCREWLRGHGMEAMDGPINFGERDKWWGLLVEGFYPPLYGMNYNPPYYRALFENYGFQLYFNQVCFAMKVSHRLDERLYQHHDRIARHPEFTARHIRKNNLDKFAKDFTYVYNKAWASHGGGKSLEEKQVQIMFAAMKPVMDEHLVWFVYHNNEPIAFWINLPDLNQYFRHMNGKFGLLQKIQFLWLQQFGECSRFVGLVFGVIPEFQGRGMDAFMIIEGAKVIQKRAKYKDFEMQWIGDFNPKMMSVAEGTGSYISRRLITYRYLFDRTREFERHVILH